MIGFIFTQRRARIKLQLCFLSHFSSFYRIDYDYIFHMEDLKYFLQINCLKFNKNKNVFFLVRYVPMAIDLYEKY